MRIWKLIVIGAAAFGCLAWPLGSGAYESLYSDVKAAGVGDIVTVIILEKTLASNTSKISTDKATSFALSGEEGTGGLDFIPGFSANADMSRNHEGTGTTERRGSIVGRMAAVVTEVGANGCLAIKGEKEILINDERETLVLTGLVRPNDISTANVVYSTDIANAKILYKGKGLVTSGSKPSLLARLISIIF